MTAPTRNDLWCLTCDRGAEGCAHPLECHCGAAVVLDSDPDIATDMTIGLASGYCRDCAAVRCDAYPGACRG
jgi:hypothetical protein